ncbi:MAG: hypothetical protein CMJ76_13765 [Planctomycetaceae bacterium]|nr:hypothetical protein [Planctomycetaceae bacterium]|tara:strand:- start:2321 stop:3325 length:1005 start_codon:yes stop_codon:yes gene_type:complete
MNEGLKISAVSHFYADYQSLDQVSLQIGSGSVHCLLGASGSGKSTLLRLVAGLEIPFAGEIKVNGRILYDEQTNLLPEKRPVGLVFQQYALFPHLTVAANIGYGISHLKRKQRLELVDKYLNLIELPDSGDAMPHELSGGEQQRVALARALCCRPQVMLLDEPFSNLDPRLRTDLRKLTLRLLKEADVATLLVTHDPREALAVAESMTILEKGKVIQSGNVEELYFKPNSLQAAKIFGPVNSISTHHKNTGMPSLPGEITDLSGLDEDGTILVRPEFIQVRHANGDSNAVVIEKTNEGSTTLLLLELESHLKVFARIPNPTSLEVDEQVHASYA